jgi:hypothetical protein
MFIISIVLSVQQVLQPTAQMVVLDDIHTACVFYLNFVEYIRRSTDITARSLT